MPKDDEITKSQPTNAETIFLVTVPENSDNELFVALDGEPYCPVYVVQFRDKFTARVDGERVITDNLRDLLLLIAKDTPKMRAERAAKKCAEVAGG